MKSATARQMACWNGTNQFVTCDVCRRVFWEGTHWQRMRALMDSVAGAPEPPDLSAAQ